jgi:hypothetical protein
MFERYTEQACRSLFFSRYEAGQLGSLTIETEHLLLGILREREALIEHLVGAAGVSANTVRQAIRERTGPPASPTAMSVEIPFTTDTKRALQYSAEEADRLLHRHIGCEHLLLGLLRLERGLAWEILNERGLALAPVRDALVLHVSATSPPPPEIAKLLLSHEVRSQRSAGVYSMTTLDGPSPGRRAATDDAGVSGSHASFSSIGFSTPADDAPDRPLRSIGPISMSGTTLSAFAQLLEGFLGRPVLDFTENTGTFDIELQGQYEDAEALIAALRDQLGLVLTRSLT